MKKTDTFWSLLTKVFFLFFVKFFCAYCSAQGDPLNSWTLRWNSANDPIISYVYSIAYGNGLFVAVGDGARLVSPDGINWTTYISPPIINASYTYTNNKIVYGGPTPTLPGVIYSDGMFAAFGTSIPDSANYIIESTNGLNWTPIYTTSNGVFNAVFAGAYGNNKWVFLATNEIISASVTSSNWTWKQFQPGFTPFSVVYGNGVFAVSGGYWYTPNFIFSSSDGSTWQYDSSIPVANALLAYGNGIFAAATVSANNGTNTYETFVSSNLVDWTSNMVCTASTSASFPEQIAYGGGQFIAEMGYNVWTSSNAMDWTNRSSLIGPGFTYGQGTFLAAGGNIYQSGVFSNSNSPTASLAISTYPGVTINGIPGRVYQIQCTTNLNSPWIALTNFSLPYSPFIWVDITSPIVGQKFYRSVELQAN